jgi:hypothetical protein
MSFEVFVDLFKYLWIPFLGLAYKIYKEAQDKQDREIDLLKSKISHQMTKDDVIEVVNNATNLLSMQMKLELEKINNGVHQLKNQNSGKDAVLLQLLEAIQAFNRNNEKK